MSPRLRAAAFALVATGFLAQDPVQARAEDLPQEVLALESGTAAELERRADRDALIVRCLRTDALRAQLGPGARASLPALVAKHRIQGANAGLRALAADAAWPVPSREEAVRALGVVGSVADVSVLGDVLPEMPEAASRALAAIGGAPAISALRRGAGDAPSMWALAALARLGDADAFDRVFEALRASPGPDAFPAPRSAIAAFAAGRDLGDDPQAWAQFARVAAWTRRFVDPDNDAAQAAAEALAREIREGRAGALGDATTLLRDDQAPVWARAKAALAIGLSGSKTANDALVAMLPSGVPGEVRRYASDALSRVGDLACAGPMVRSLVHDEDRDRLQAKRAVRIDFVPVDPAMARCLVRRGVRGVGLLLIEMMEAEMRTGYHRDAMRAWDELTAGADFGYEPDASKPERMAAIARMKAWWADARERLPVAVRADDPGFPALRAEVDAMIRELGAFKFLNQMRAKKALVVLAEAAEPQLVAALADASLHVRMGAADVMATADLGAFAAPLSARLAGETNSAVRTRLLAALAVCARTRGGEPTKADLAPVRAALSDRAIDVRIAAAQALGAGGAAADAALLRDERAKPQNQTPAYRAASAGALARLGDWSGAGDLAAELACDDVQRRTDALAAVRAAGKDLPGYSPDGPPESRTEALRVFLASVGASVPGGGQK